MFSALKKLVGSDQPLVRDKNIPAGMQSMNQTLQRRFAKGVQYNMKIVIRGDRNTGKTTLWHRLQGKKFLEEYLPTQEIQVTCIHWNYKTTDDVVKVEVWDVVDKGYKILPHEALGKCKKRGDGLKLENDPQEAESEMALDAEFLDVYKNCNGVVMMFDITKQWTFNYLMKELPKVPNHIPVCVLGNYRDMGEHRVILPDDVRECMDRLNRPRGSSYIRYAESSMKNSFGLKYLHKFFNIPFLQLQRETLLRQLETNQLDIDATLEELSVQQETEDQNYDIFLEMMETRNRGYTSPLATNGQSPSSGSQSPVVPPSSASTGSSSPGTPQQPVLQTTPNPVPAPATSPSPVPEAALPRAPSPPAVAPAAAPQQKRSIISRLFGSSTSPETSESKPDAGALKPSETPAQVQCVDDFVPDEGLDGSFLEDVAPQKGKERTVGKETQDTDSDGDTGKGNPMVANFQDDLDPDDKMLKKPPVARAHIPSKDIQLSSDEGGEEQLPKVAVMADEDIDLDKETKQSSKNFLKMDTTSAATKVLEQNPVASLLSSEKTSGTKLALGTQGNSVTMTVISPAAAALAQDAKPKPTSQTKGSSLKQKVEQKQESSESDPEGPIAVQMLSFIMDDPDFESEDSNSPRKKVDVFPVREDISDLSDDDVAPAKLPDPLKPSTRSFKPKNEADLFGLGFEEKAAKESSEEDKDGKHSSKEKKKKKKKNKEEEDKSGKKKSKHRKIKEKEKEGGEEKKKKRKSKEKNEQVDELEAFLGGGDTNIKRSGGGDYEEL
ncbi:rab-like protein 6 isoform X2 [Latimeria chalumnae]|uniref:rab-like protein 6 isoform X2 n=1 Tax=Latimeria chalumnae TaxID=7897 RepID=UPI00313E40C6